MFKIKKIVYSIVSIASIVGIFFFILSAFSDRISPSFSVYFAYLGMGFPFIFILNLLLCGLWALFRKWRWVLVYIITYFVCWESISTYFPVHFRSKDMPSESIKLLTYNVMRFDHEKPHLPGNPNPILKYIVDSNADIICLQEYSAFIKHNHLTETDIKRALKKYPYYRLLKLNGSSSNYIYGMALFSKYPISAFDDIALESAFNGAFIAELKIKDKKVTLISVHLESNRLSMKERATYYELTKEFDSSTFEEMRSEMNKRLAPAFKKRAEQAQLISEYIKKSINPYTIVCGDFNDTPISYSRHTIKGDLRDAFVETGTGLGTSYNRYRFLFRIDYILHSKNITPYRCTVDYAIRSSDHYPIWTCLQLN